MTVSRSLSRWPSAPITPAPPKQKTSSPQTGESEMTAAPAAPAKPTWERAWAANAVRRRTTK